MYMYMSCVAGGCRLKQQFRVIVVLPLLPAFEGELGTSTGSAIQAVTHWNYNSICRGGRSLLERLNRAGVPDPFEYISFYGLRNHGELNGSLVRAPRVAALHALVTTLSSCGCTSTCTVWYLPV